MIAHSFRPRNLRAWVSNIHEAYRTQLDTLPSSGTLDPVEFCRTLICSSILRIMLGDGVRKDPVLLQRFVHAFHECDSKSSFKSPIKALFAVGDVNSRGERKIYVRVRDLPLVDEAMRECINKAKVELGGERHKQNSVLASLASSWYYRQTNGNLEDYNLTRTRIANNMFTFSFAAYSNILGMAVWVLYHCLKDTVGLQSILKKELLNPENQANSAYPTIEKMIMEIGRLYTPGDFHRKLKEDWPLPSNQKVVIPKGTNVLISGLTTQREESRFPKPLKIDTDRDYKSSGGAFPPFGALVLILVWVRERGKIVGSGTYWVHERIKMFSSRTLHQVKATYTSPFCKYLFILF